MLKEVIVPFNDSTEPVPTGLKTDTFVLRPIVVGDVEMDYAAVMETRVSLRLWQQSTWPADDFTVEANRKDLVDLEERHNARRAFTYTVLDPTGAACLGCVYVFPTTAKFLAKCTVTAVGGDKWSDVNAVVYFWVRQSQIELGTDVHLLAALRGWFADEWKLDNTVYVTSEPFSQQVELLENTDLQVKFRLHEPGEPGDGLVFG